MKSFLNPKEIKEQLKKFKSMLFAVRNFLESARREGLPVWQLDIKEIETLVADFEGELLRLSDIEREWESKQPEFEELQAVGIEFLERAKKVEIHNQVDYEKALQLRADAVAHEQLIHAKFSPFIEAIEQSYYRLLTQEQRLLALCRLDTEGSA